jgi:pentose-5-phosphate-3-epimerase
MRAAIAINPGTPTSEISNELGNAVDMILVMTVWPGYGGQKFMKECMPKASRQAEKDQVIEGSSFEIIGRRAASPVSRSRHRSRRRCRTQYN